MAIMVFTQNSSDRFRTVVIHIIVRMVAIVLIFMIFTIFTVLMIGRMVIVFKMLKMSVTFYNILNT